MFEENAWGDSDDYIPEGITYKSKVKEFSIAVKSLNEMMKKGMILDLSGSKIGICNKEFEKKGNTHKIEIDIDHKCQGINACDQDGKKRKIILTLWEKNSHGGSTVMVTKTKDHLKNLLVCLQGNF